MRGGAIFISFFAKESYMLLSNTIFNNIYAPIGSLMRATFALDS